MTEYLQMESVAPRALPSPSGARAMAQGVGAWQSFQQYIRSYIEVLYLIVCIVSVCLYVGFMPPTPTWEYSTKQAPAPTHCYCWLK